MKRFKSHKLVSLVLLTLASIGCSKNDGPTVTDASYMETVVPTDINALYQGVGDAALDTVIVHAQGGPSPKLLTEDIEEPGLAHYYRVYAAQAQHLNASISENEITFEQAIAEDEISTEIYYKVLKHFKDQGKYVIAMSHSFGSFILPNALAKYPNIADKIVIMAGRLDMPEEVWHGFRDGNTLVFDNGTDIVPSGDPQEMDGGLSATRLQAGLGKNRYTQLLADKDLTNLLYVYSEADVAVGRLTQTEEDFLISKNSGLIAVPEGGHSDTFAPQVLETVVDDWIRK